MQAEPEWRVFRDIYLQRVWGSGETASGSGSTLQTTAPLRPRLREVFRRLKIRSLVDAACGDMNWMRHLDYQFDKFIGIDIVDLLITKLRSESFPSNYFFQVNNIVTDILPAADAVLCRDCLNHLPLAAVLRVLDQWRVAGFRYAFVTTFPLHAQNLDCVTGGWRPLNMQAPPFNWPEPICILSDIDPKAGPSFRDKSLGVWAL